MPGPKKSPPASHPTRYRPCVGAMVIDRRGHVWLGRRNDDAEHLGEMSRWQMPQGGIDKDEDPRAAVLRELYEETSITSVEIRAETSGWLCYDLPNELMGIALRGRYRGQKQKWFLLEFVGEESEIEIQSPGGGAHEAEFDAWKWVEPGKMLDLIVPFKRGVYDAVFAEFAPLIARTARP